MESINNIELNWIEEPATYTFDRFNRVRGYIAKQPIFVVVNPIGTDDWILNNYATVDCKLFKGTLQECKNQANTLINGITREV
jgi:hypothetical protein